VFSPDSEATINFGTQPPEEVLPTPGDQTPNPLYPDEVGPPILRLFASGHRSIEAVLLQGLPVGISCNEACTAKIGVKVRLHFGGFKSLTPKGPVTRDEVGIDAGKTVDLRLSLQSLKDELPPLSAFRSGTVKITVTAFDDSRHDVTASQTILLSKQLKRAG
jgi:hypothetical protein